MIPKLILKDLKANYSSIFLRSFLPALIAGSVLVYRFYPWHVYMMYGYLMLTFASSIYLFIEAKPANEVKTLTLPVNRTAIVIAKYVTSIVIVVVGLSAWIGNAWLAERFFPDAKSEFQSIFRIKTIFMAVLFFMIHLSIFLPSVFRCRYMGMVTTFISALFLAILSIAEIFRAYSGSYNPVFEAGDLMQVLFLTLFILVAPAISAVMSVMLYKTKEI